MSVNHVLRETGHMLIRWFVELLFDIALHLLDHIIGPIIRIGSISTTAANIVDLLVIVEDLLDLVHHVLVIAQIGEELLNQRQLGHRHLIVELLVTRAHVLVV